MNFNAWQFWNARSSIVAALPKFTSVNAVQFEKAYCLTQSVKVEPKLTDFNFVQLKKVWLDDNIVTLGKFKAVILEQLENACEPIVVQFWNVNSPLNK